MIFWYTALLHWVWFVLLSTNADLPYATPVAALSVLTFSNRLLLLTALLVSVIGRLLRWAVLYRWPMVSIIALVPQFGLVLGSAELALLWVVAGHYPDGVVRPSLFILIDQFPSIALAIIYTFNMVHLLIRWLDVRTIRRLFREWQGDKP